MVKPDHEVEFRPVDALIEALPQVAFDWLSLGSYASGVEDDAGALPPPLPLDHPAQVPVNEDPALPFVPATPAAPVP